jgi:uncharacterized membrane protein YtjA (UPF0391 family)
VELASRDSLPAIISAKFLPAQQIQPLFGSGAPFSDFFSKPDHPPARSAPEDTLHGLSRGQPPRVLVPAFLQIYFPTDRNSASPVRSMMEQPSASPCRLHRIFNQRRTAMLRWALIFFIVAIVAALLGFTGIAGAAASIAKIIFTIFVVLLLISLLVLALGGRPPPAT